MLTKKNKKDCCMVSNLEFCEQNSCNETSSDAVEVVQKTNMILSNDQFLILRTLNGNEQGIYKAAFSDLAPEVALLIIEQATKAMPRTDPSDGRSLWIDEGFIRIASGDPTQLGTIAPTAMQKSLAEAFKVLPTSDPGDGGPWLNGGVLMRGSDSNLAG
ncbi:LSm family protein [Commensalibacter communis]|uniref:Uncharacterized protein n=2 Tax=Commensalibacter communis TaxID=2972786 RepID=A0A9W4TQ11_9PROT|nr:hypothetical protein [Commensalibacter communis]CAI3956860.1 unnamed protein product [Commensalibacter communis]CAI3957923.1 unnamed protein product [Commensalibacter communis]CAI3958638.1 unnamed protein product [Commensalibacter communis]CAI3959531.1 unnamed protein product [Commensalibacter communis]CAI3959707.1 unnamed protein product [Commensalibacter communis]